MAFNRQQFFNNAVRGIIQQGGPAVTLGGECRYRTNTGAKCVVGHNIPDKKYSPKMEGSVPDLNGYYNQHAIDVAKACGIKTEEDVSFARCMQRLHDDLAKVSPFLPTFVIQARAFAKRYDLDASVCDEYKPS